MHSANRRPRGTRDRGRARSRCGDEGGGPLRADGRRLFRLGPLRVDAIMMKHIIHDWSDENSLRILKSCHDALPAAGKLLIIDAVILPGNDTSPGKMLDIQVLLMGGRERTEEEFHILLNAGGFE